MNLYLTIGRRGDCLCLHLGKFIVAFIPSDATGEEFFVVTTSKGGKLGKLV